MKNSQKGFLVPIIIIIIAALAIGGLYFYSKGSLVATKNVITNPHFANAQICNPGSIEKQPQSTQDACNEQIAMDTKNPALCDKIQSRGGIMLNCYASTAISTRNPDVCKKIVDTDNTTYRSNCYDMYASTLLKPEICEKITFGQDSAWYRDTCYRDTANKAKDKSICSKIIDKGIKSNCLSGI